MRYVKNIPKEVLNFFKLNFPKSKYFFYTYSGVKGLVYGCNVCRSNLNIKSKRYGERFKTRKTPKLFHNATQAYLSWFKENQFKKIY